MKQSLITLILLLNLGCINTQNITWYEKEVIQELRENDGRFIVQIGISPQVFYLDKNIEDYETVLKLVEESHKNRTSIKIGIENNTNKILFVQKINKN